MNNNIQILRAEDSPILEDKYLKSMKQLILRIQKDDPTIVLHTDNEIMDKYKNSLIAILDDEIIWNTSIYNTKMKPLDNIYFAWNKINIWECGSSFVKKEYREIWLWKELVNKWLEVFWSNFDALVWATVNDIMFHLRCSFWFEQIPFPQEYYDEWKEFLSKKMKWWIDEFWKRAKCIMHFQSLSDDVRKHILDILLRQ